VSVLLDLAGVTEPGERVFSISHTNVSLPAGVSFVRADPPQLMLHLDRAPAPADRTLEPKRNSASKQSDTYLAPMASAAPPGNTPWIARPRSPSAWHWRSGSAPII